MAIIGKIRDKSGLLLIVVGLAMLAFIMGGWDNIFGGYTDNMGIGKVYGELVDQEKYRVAVENTIMQDQQQFMQSQREYTPKDQIASEEKAWNMFVDGVILEKEFEKLGIDCSDKELDAYLYGDDGFTVMPNLAQSFQDSVTHQFNRNLLEKRIEEMESSADPKVSEDWENNKKQMKEGRKNEKYFQLLSQGVYVTKLEAKEEYRAQKEVKNISFVLKRYSEIPDDQIKVTDDMVRKFYEEHKNEKKYEATAGRDVRYFDFTIQPSKADSTKFNEEMAVLKANFMATKSAKDDSIFVLTNSDLDYKVYSSSHRATYKPENDPKAKELTYPNYMDTIFKAASIGQIVGPYDDKGKIRLAKVIDFNTKVCKVRHILLNAPEGDAAKIAAAQKQADSIMKTLNKDNFAEYVTKYSQDQGSVANGGVYEDFLDYEMVPEFSKFATDEPIGKIGTVKTQFGIHIIEVMDRKEARYPVLAVIQKTLKPSEESETIQTDKAYNLLYKFDGKISRKKNIKDKIALFDSLAQLEGLYSRPVRILDESPKVQGFETTFAEDRILKLAYDENAQVGDLCSSPIKDQRRYIIAMVTSIREKGVPNFEDVEERMRIEVMKERKAKRFTQMMINEKSLEALARKTNSQISKGEVTFANPQIPEGGYEPEIIGSLFSGLKDGQLSIPLKGEQGVYVIQITKTIKAPAAANYNKERDELLANARSQMQNQSKAALKKLADVKDNRRFSALGIRRE